MQSTPGSTLRSLGKTVFVEFYYDFKNAHLGGLSLDDLAYKLMTENPRAKDNTFQTQKGRGSNGKTIFDKAQNIQALQIIIDSRVPMDIKDKAKKILRDETAIKKW